MQQYVHCTPAYHDPTDYDSGAARPNVEHAEQHKEAASAEWILDETNVECQGARSHERCTAKQAATEYQKNKNDK